MISKKKSAQEKLLFIVLFCLSPVSVSQTTASTTPVDILDFLPAIIAGIKSDVDTAPPLPDPPTDGVGNFRIAKTEIFNRLQPVGKLSELINSWDSVGNVIEENVTVFDLFGDSPSGVNSTVVSNTEYDQANRPLSSSYTNTIDADTQDAGTRQFDYQNGKLQSTLGVSILTSKTEGTITTNIETVFEYSASNLLIGATVVISQSNNNIISTAQHTVGYASNNRVNSHRIVMTNNATNTSDETIHSHRYDSVGNLIESVTTTSTNLEIIKTFGSLVGNQASSTVLVRNQVSGETLSNTLIVATYELGVCVMRGPDSPFVIEGNITASIPYSPNVGCISR